MKVEHRETKVSQNKGEIKEKEGGFYSLLILYLRALPQLCFNSQNSK